MIGGSKRLGKRGRTLKMLLGELGVRLKDVSHRKKLLLIRGAWIEGTCRGEGGHWQTWQFI